MKTLIIGASTNPERYSYKAAERLLENDHKIELLGNKQATVFDHKIQTETIGLQNIHTVTMYVSAKIQPEYYQKIIDLKPERVIFNPGTENPEFTEMLEDNNIKVEHACTLVLLATDSY